MKLGYLICYVPDVEQTITFYEQAFNLKCTFLHESKQYAELDTGNTKLSFASEALAESHQFEFVKNSLKHPPAGIEIALVTPNVETAFEHAVKAGAISLKKPEQKPWGQIISYVRDLNGILVELCSPIDMP